MTFDPSKYAGAGLDNLPEGGAMPLIRILQGKCPQLNKQKSEFIPGATEGDLFFAATGEVLSRPVQIIPLNARTCYVEWVPRNKGGGLVAVHDLSIIDNPNYEKGRDPAKPYLEHLGDNELIFTTYWFVLALIDEEWVQALLTMSSTNLSVSRSWSSQIKKFRYPNKAPMPIFGCSWSLGTDYREKDSGDFYVFKISDPVVLDLEKDSDLLTLAAENFDHSEEVLPSLGNAAVATAPELTDEEAF